jgi:hypothetical protein
MAFWAESLEEKIRELAAADSAEASLVTEILQEVEGQKPARLSLRENKHLRDEFRSEKRAEHRTRNVDIGPLNFKI